MLKPIRCFKLAPWSACRWKCHYRLMMRDDMYDGQSVEDVYALALLVRLGRAVNPEKMLQEWSRVSPSRGPMGI